MSSREVDNVKVEALLKMWPRPRLGQWVKLKKNGWVVEVLAVRSARQVLAGMTEVDAMVMGPRNQAIYGMHWLEVYFEVEYMTSGPSIGKVMANEIEAIVERP